MRNESPSVLSWILPFIALEWVWEWVAFALSNWTFLEVLEYLGSFSVLVAVVFYFSESGDRIKQRHYQAWQVINTAQGKGGSGGRIEALQELNEDKVPLVGVDVSSAVSAGDPSAQCQPARASNFSAADLRNSDLSRLQFRTRKSQFGQLSRRGARSRDFCQADLRNADLNGSSLADADLAGAVLDDADLRGADLTDVQWQHLKSIASSKHRRCPQRARKASSNGH